MTSHDDETRMTHDDVATFGPTLKLLLHEEAERQHRIAHVLETLQSEPGDGWVTAASHVHAYARVLADIANNKVDGLANGRSLSDLNSRAFLPAVAKLLLVEASRLADLATMLPSATPASRQFARYRNFLIEVVKLASS